jgi:glycosyltransferase involved in cell wall biosynthesis
MEFVSVIIPTYNSASTLARAVDSVLAQTRPADEIIVVDDGSTDETEALVKERFPQVRYHYHENRGLAATRNAGAKLAQGDILGLLDSDDEWVPEKLERQLSVLRKRTDLAAVGCHRIRVKLNAEGQELWRKSSRRADGVVEDIVFADEIWSNRICGASMLLRRDVFNRLGGYDATMRCSEDHDLWLRMLGAGERLAVLREALYVFYDRPGSLRSNLDLLSAAWAGILEKWDPSESPEVQRLLTADRYAAVCKWWWLKLTFRALLAGDRERGRRYALEAARYRSGKPLLEVGGVAARVTPGLFMWVGKVKGYPRPTG